MTAAGVGLAGAAVTLSGSAPAARFLRTDRYHETMQVTKLGSRLADSQSSNWSGYNQGILDTETPFSSISGTWVVPRAVQHTRHQAEDSATWIGIGGGCLDTTCAATDGTLIQAGTEQQVSAAGKASYDAWYEVIPAPEIESSIKVHPGNVVHCSIKSTAPGVWTIVLADTTDHQHFTETVPYPSDESTAEWIEETPTEIGTSGSSLAALPTLGRVEFSGARANGRAAHLVRAQGIQLVNAAGKPLATPSRPVDGVRFSDCTWARSCPAP